MSDRLTLETPPISAVYAQEECNAPITLGVVPIEYKVGDTTYSDDANAVMKFVPETRLAFVCPLDDKPPSIGLEIFYKDGASKKISLTKTGVSFVGHCVAAGEEYGGLVFSPAQSAVAVTKDATAIASARFHLFNFPPCHGRDDYILKTGDPPFQGMRLCGRIILEAGGWKITIAANAETRDMVKSLKAAGGFALTHVGEIVRDDGRIYTSKELEDVLTCLRYFLSFCLGRWAGVALPVGLDGDSNRVYEQWGMPIVAEGAWNSSYSWFCEDKAEWLSDLFAGFWKLWNTELWRTPLTHSLYWYLGACDRGVGIGVDTGLILAQTALEGLAWTYCVQDRKMVSGAAFKPRGLSAADKFRLLLTAMEIPTAIPSDLSALNGKAGERWSDGPDAITAVRNQLVHPHETKKLPEGSYYEGWNLSLSYIDLVILRLCDYYGEYSNRLTKMHQRGIERVPWVKSF